MGGGGREFEQEKHVEDEEGRKQGERKEIVSNRVNCQIFEEKILKMGKITARHAMSYGWIDE